MNNVTELNKTKHNITGTIAILYGGPSVEREVSLVSGNEVSKALTSMNVKNVLVDLVDGWEEKLKKAKPSFVFLALHGCPGEDGVVQAALEMMGYPYQGSGVLSSGMAMDKSIAKILFRDAGLDVAEEQLIKISEMPTSSSGININKPFVIKPVKGGSSLGVSIVKTEEQWQKAVAEAKKYATGEYVMIEEYIPGRELTVSVLGENALAVTELLPSADREFYDYEGKYTDGGLKHQCPALLNDDIYKKCMDIAVTAHNSLYCAGVTRTDIRYDEKTGRLVILETNTLPGLTPKSLVPEQARLVKMSFNELISWMIEEGTCRKQNAA